MARKNYSYPYAVKYVGDGVWTLEANTAKDHSRGKIAAKTAKLAQSGLRPEIGKSLTIVAGVWASPQSGRSWTFVTHNRQREQERHNEVAAYLRCLTMPPRRNMVYLEPELSRYAIDDSRDHAEPMLLAQVPDLDVMGVSHYHGVCPGCYNTVCACGFFAVYWHGSFVRGDDRLDLLTSRL